MNPLRKKRLLIIVAILAGVGIAVTLALSALQENINLFYTPTQIANGEAPHDTRIRAGGMVEKGSLRHEADGVTIRFTVTDGKAQVAVTFKGIAPDLFREGSGVVAEGAFDTQGTFVASNLLAKHDERYMPREMEGMQYDETTHQMKGAPKP